MTESFVNSLAHQGTPEMRNEKSSYLRRSLLRSSAHKTNTGDTTRYTSPQVRMSTESTLPYSSASGVGGFYESQFLMDASNVESFITENGNLATDLCQEFLDLYTSYPGEHEVFDLLLRYEELCLNSAKMLEPTLKKTAPMQQKHVNASQLIRELRLERNTWRLVRTLYQDRIEYSNSDEEEMMLDFEGKRISDKQLIENFFMRNSFVRQSQLVVDWLEKNAADDFGDECKNRMQYFSDQSTISWEHTLHDLKMRTPLSRPTKDSLITELDPDAPIRQRNNVLHSEDKEIEVRLLKTMFMCMRCGNLVEAQKLAENFGYPWLAASLEGWRLFHDPNYDDDTLVDGKVLKPIEGNKYRDIWKAACWKMSQEPRIPMYQQALFGCLSGNLKAVIPACLNWYDCLWAYIRVLVDKLTEQELRSNTQNIRKLEELPAEYWDKIPDFEQIFQELQAMEGIRKEGQGPHSMMQKYIILDDADGCIETMHTWSQQTDPPPSSQLLRIMAHLVLFFRTIGHSSKEDLCVSILEKYVKELIKQRKIPLIASYTATLPPPHQVIWYAKFLEGITDPAERKLCLKYAEDAGLDIPSITKTVVVNVTSKAAETIDPTASMARSVTTSDDEYKIGSLAWLFYDPMQRAEALKQANALLRVFIACEKLDAARQVLKIIPSDSVTLISSQSQQGGELSAVDDNAIREYLCFKAYLEAFDSFNDWFQHFQHAKPVRPELPSGDSISFKEKVAYDHQMQQHELEVESWENALMAQTKTATDRLYNILIFVGGGWLVDQRTEDIVDENRQKQMSLLRKLCIPQVTKLLHSVLYNTRQYKQSIQIADLIASEQYQLYKEFSAQELQNLLSAIKDSSLELVKDKKDCLGYPSPQNIS